MQCPPVAPWPGRGGRACTSSAVPYLNIKPPPSSLTMAEDGLGLDGAIVEQPNMPIGAARDAAFAGVGNVVSDDGSTSRCH